MLPSRLAAFVLAGTLTCAGCKSNEPWAFACSASAYDGANMERVGKSLPESSGCAAIATVVVVCCLPFAVDVVLLPITLTHDAVACR